MENVTENKNVPFQKHSFDNITKGTRQLIRYFDILILLLTCTESNSFKSDRLDYFPSGDVINANKHKAYLVDFSSSKWFVVTFYYYFVIIMIIIITISHFLHLD